MDLTAGAKFFDDELFEGFSFADQAWTAGTFKGQLKIADQFLTIYNRPTRKRMLHTGPNEVIGSSVVRSTTNGEIYLVGASQMDVFHRRPYRRVVGIHRAHPASVSRLSVAGPSNNPGWATSAVVRHTYGDIELRSVNENEEQAYVPHGHYLLFMPSDEDLRPKDNVIIQNENYHVLEVYRDANLVTARAIQRGEERVNMVYRDFTGMVYNHAAASNTPTYTNYNITARAALVTSEEVGNTDIHRDEFKFLVQGPFIGITPALDDLITYLGVDYRVFKVWRDAGFDEWHLWARR